MQGPRCRTRLDNLPRVRDHLAGRTVGFVLLRVLPAASVQPPTMSTGLNV